MDMRMQAQFNDNGDPYDLVRFYLAQESNYQDALAELKAGKKRTHWMWYVFPQIEGLAQSSMSHFYSIKSLDEAKAYIQHPLLSARLLESTAAVLQHSDKSLREIFGKPDDKKFCSSITLFSLVSHDSALFSHAIDVFCSGQADSRTLQLLKH
jgi:uncharacterized protein (DUF1810 family)